MTELQFGPHGPFDNEERACIAEATEALEACGNGETRAALAFVVEGISLLERQGALLNEFLVSCSISPKKLTERLLGSDPATFEILLPTSAFIARGLIMAEVNFYRELARLCRAHLPAERSQTLRPRLTRRVCECLYTRLAEEVLAHIASDDSVSLDARKKAVLALNEIWSRATYRVMEFFPILEATWEARRQVRVTLGTLAGTQEVFSLLASGCDARFVDYFTRTRPSEEEQQAFREFLFGSSTESLDELEQRMRREGMQCATCEDIEGSGYPNLFGTGDPALALYAFFLSRHVRAAARRLSHQPGPKRTAEEYVMLAYLRRLPSGRFSSQRIKRLRRE